MIRTHPEGCPAETAAAAEALQAARSSAELCSGDLPSRCAALRCLRRRSAPCPAAPRSSPARITCHARVSHRPAASAAAGGRLRDAATGRLCAWRGRWRGNPRRRSRSARTPWARTARSPPATGDSAAIYCGTWQEPSAHVRSGGAAGGAQLAQLATASPWRAAIDTRFRCEQPTATTILGSNPAELMQCTRLVGGWAHVAMVAAVNGTVWYADGVLPAARVMERSIGVLAGVMQARRGAGEFGRGRAAGEQVGGAGVQLGRCGAVRRTDDGGHPRQPGGQYGRRGNRVPGGPGAAAESARQGQSEHRDDHDVAGPAAFQRRPLRRGRCAVRRRPASWCRDPPKRSRRRACCIIAGWMR